MYPRTTHVEQHCTGSATVRDVVIGMASSGIHSNGYSLVRRVINHAGWALDRQVSELGRTLGEELLEPTRVYAADCIDLVRALNGKASGPDLGTDLPLRGFSHVTGGGLAANLARVLPKGLLATVDRSTWELPAVFKLVAELGGVPQSDLERTLNLGVGMVAIVAPEAEQPVLQAMRGHELGRESRAIGTVQREHAGLVTLRTPLGTTRILDMLAGDQLPRIC